MPDPSTTQSPSGLVRALGVWGLAASIVNVTIGGGIFRLPASAAGSLGTGAPVAYLVCAVVMGLIVLCFAEAGSRVAMTGGPYAYVEVAFGPFFGFLAGALLWIVGTLALAAVATIFVDSVGALAPILAGGAARLLILLTTLVLLAAVNIRGVREGTHLNNVATVAKLLPLLLLIVVGAFAIDTDALAWQAAPATSEVARTSILLIFAFAGVESALVPSGEVRDVARTVPRAILIGMVTITLMYIAIHLVAQGVLGGDLAAQGTPLAEAGARVFGPWGRTLLLVGAAVSMFGYISGMTLAVPRALYALGRDGFLPGWMAAVHPRFKTPHVAIAVQTVIVAVLALTSAFEKLAILANLATLLLYAGCCAAAVQLRRRNVQEGGIPFRVPAAGVVPFAALAAIGWLLTSVRLDEWLVAAAVIVVAAGVYFATGGRRERLRAAPSVE